jgi:FKBP-type peptidyl-prolyl cis-trans isomerase
LLTPRYLQGLNDGIDGMKVGGLRLISVPPQLAFGDKGRLPLVPPSAEVEFAISLLSCKRAGTNPNSVVDFNSQIY